MNTQELSTVELRRLRRDLGAELNRLRAIAQEIDFELAVRESETLAEEKAKKISSGQVSRPGRKSEKKVAKARRKADAAFAQAMEIIQKKKREGEL